MPRYLRRSKQNCFNESESFCRPLKQAVKTCIRWFVLGTCTYQYNRNITNQNETQDPGEEQKTYYGPPESLTLYTKNTQVIIPFTRPHFLGVPKGCVSLRKHSNPNNILIVLCTGLYTRQNICCTKDVLHTPLLLSLCVCVIHYLC